MGLMEWSFVTAQADGTILTMDGNMPKEPVTVKQICMAEGWEPDHAAYDTDMHYWRLILSRPLQPMMPTRGHLDDAVMIGAA